MKYLVVGYGNIGAKRKAVPFLARAVTGVSARPLASTRKRLLVIAADWITGAVVSAALGPPPPGAMPVPTLTAWLAVLVLPAPSVAVSVAVNVPSAEYVLLPDSGPVVPSPKAHAPLAPDQRSVSVAP